ncbi:SDR family oxidoreductase [Arthrobacter sp. AK01]|uniref:SDR family NAD(P)-dependent oxidoreductase n=1 Tax=Micrococcaceae TaxID=1268 RepID=UPI001E404830|nr:MULTISPECIES: SDR family oxidoreductase [Micrococcaceae]MCD4852018.1 SDR family oxidoreductase [Arthrobacter sp. AK01]MCP1413764.1 3alpha(or 20beta)-hydroxysteroid dehydrogenase [Paenarthrobacter sp. A20]
MAVVTGAGSRGGQGEAEARLLALNGSKVILVDLETSEGASIATEIGPEKAQFFAMDVTDATAWNRLATLIRENFPTIDILVYNAGIWLDKGVFDTSPEEYRRVVEVNQTGVYLGMHTLGPLMQESGGGSIINTCSTSGLKGAGMPHAYAASKWAVRGMSRAAAYELAAFGIRVNAICPGVIDTPMIEGGPGVLSVIAETIPSGRVGKPEDVAQLVLFLASHASSHISGAEIAIDAAVSA